MTLRRPLVSEVYDSVAGRRDADAMAGLVRSCVAALGGSVSSPEGAAAYIGALLAPAAPTKSYEQMLAELHRAPWIAGLDAAGYDASRELLPEDCEEMKAELRLRSERILSTLEALFPGVRCVEAVSLTRVYRLSDRPSASQAEGSVADVFQSIECRMEQLKIADYSIMQTSLEHVFNQLATQE